MSGSVKDYGNINLSGNYTKDVTLVKNIFCKDAVLKTREIKMGGKVRCALFYVDGMVDASLLGETVIKPLVSINLENSDCIDCDFIQNSLLFAIDVTKTHDFTDMLRAVLYGDTLLIAEQNSAALTIDTKGFKTRGITEPESEHVLQGPREGFDEAALPNLAMIRRKLLTPDLCIERIRVGRRTDTQIYVCYLGSLADEKTVKKIKSDLSSIDIDGILDSNYITELINRKRTLLKTAGSTERPDVVAARLLEGRIAVMVDGTPMVLTLPYLFSENFQSDEDYYINFYLASFSRILRFVCFFISVCLPGVFVALTTHHFELLPTHFALTVSRLRSGVPIASVSECIALVFAFEILKEAGLRMPQNLGHALSVVGGLVMGQAAVEAGIISAPMLIAVAFSSIAGLMVPRLMTAVFYWRLCVIIACAVLGLYGFFTVITLFALKIFSTYSFGVDYTVSFNKPDFYSLKDSFIRTEWRKMKTRPIFNRNRIRKSEDR